MVNNDLVEYVRSTIKAGHSESSIRGHLKKHGHPVSDIDDVFRHIKKDNFEASKRAAVKRKVKKSNFGLSLKDNHLVIFLVGFLLIAVVFGIFSLFLTSDDSTMGNGSDFCGGVSIAVHELYNQKVLCAFSDNSKVQMILKNTGQDVINHVQIDIEQDSYKNSEVLESINLASDGPASLITKVSAIDSSRGGVKKVILIPGVQVDGTKVMCNSKKVVYDIVGVC